MSALEIQAVGPVAPVQGAARPLPAATHAPGSGRSGTPVTAPAVKADFAAGEPLSDVEMPLQREWRMAEALAAIGGGPRAEWLIRVASRPGPVPPGSLLEAIKMLGIADLDSRSSRAV
jgi:hypothetical protein